MDASATMRIPLTKGFSTIVDAERFETELNYTKRDGNQALIRPSCVKWYAMKNRNHYYAFGQHRCGLLSLHRLLIEAPAGRVTDHIDGDTLNNVLSNLRIVTHSQNAMNHRTYKNSPTPYRGVRRFPSGLFAAQIHISTNGIKRTIAGSVRDTAEQAARDYDDFALHYFGEFARLNFPHEYLVNTEGK